MIHNFPYTDFHEINLDWLMKQITELRSDMIDFEAANQIVYCDQWDITQSYAKYSLVVDNNIGYLSIQPVPAGIPLNNTDYWLEVADFSAQIAGLGTRMTNVENAVNVIGPVANMSKQKVMANTKCLLVGNSYAYGSGGSGGSGWAHQFVSLTGCNADIIEQRGGDFCQPATNTSPLPTYPSMTYRQAITTFISTKTTAELAEYRHIIFGGGYNDAAFLHTYSDIVTEITATVSLIHTNFPNAEITIVPLLSTTHKNAGGAMRENFYKLTVQAWSMGAAINGCRTTSHSADWFYHKYEYRGSGSSNIHLNDDGYLKCAQYILSIINGWDGSIYEDYTDEVIASSYVTTNTYIHASKRDSDVNIQANITIQGDQGSPIPANMVNLPLFTLPPELVQEEYNPIIYAWINTANYRGLYALQVTSATNQVVIANNSHIADLPVDTALELRIEGNYKTLS